MCSLGLSAQEVKILSDLTSKLTNADFSADAPVTATIATYDYNMPDDGAGAGGEGLFGQQPVTGWTASTPSDNIKVMQSNTDTDRGDGTNARAAGIFALTEVGAEGTPGLGGDEYPAPGVTEAAEAGVTGPVLGIVAVWGGDLSYTQPVTLPAGDYMMVVTYFNIGVGTTITTNNTGFAAGDDKYMSTRKEFPTNVWERDTVIFRLAAETEGVISIGLKGDGGSGGAAHLFFDNVKLYNIDTNYLDQVAINEAKATLLALIQEGEDYGVDVSESQAVYDNPNATLEEVKAAIEKQKELNEAGITDLSEFFITNPKFSQGDAVVGGICTYDYDCEKNGIPTTNFSMLDVPGWTQKKKDNGAAAGVFAVGSDAFLGGVNYNPPTTLSDGVTTDANLLGVVTCWSMAAQYTQSTTLPAGRYTVIISYYNSGGANAVAKNLNGFVASDGTEYLGEMLQYPVGKWATETISFELGEETEGYFSLGYQSTNTGSGNMPHLFVDGFSLYYIGTGIDPSILALNAAVTQGEKLLDEKFNAELKDAFEAVIATGQDLINDKSSDADANKAATSAITSMLNDVKASIEAYAKLDVFRQELEVALDKYNAQDYADLNNRLSELKDNSDDAYDGGTWTNEEIDAAIASYDVIVKEEIQKLWDAAVASGEKLNNDLDITGLFDQMAYTYSTSAVQGANVPDKEWNYGNATNFKTQFGTAEVWNQSPFRVSRTLENMPAGKYTITTKAFFRNADNATNYSMYDPANTPEAYLFAGAAKKGLTNVAAIASDEEKAEWTDAGGVFVPNSQKTAYEVFNDEAYTDMLETSVSTVVVSDGNLTFGVGADEMQANSWVIWYSFSIAYNAPDKSALLDVLAALDEQSRNVQEELGNVAIVMEADDKLNEAQNEYESANSMSDEELKALVTKYESAIAYTEQSIALIKELEETYEFYNSYLIVAGDVQSDEPTYNELLSNIEAGQTDGYDSNEQIQSYIQGLKDGWVPFVQYPVLETSSEQEPGNITAAIYNAGFIDPVTNENNANGWDITSDGGSNNGANDTYEFYNANSFRISQTIKGLAEGYYRIRVQAFYRAGTNIANADTLTLAPDSIVCAYVFGETATGGNAKAVKNVLERENEDGELETTMVGVEGEVEVTNYKDYESFYVPNDRASFAEYCSMGIYWNQVDVYVGEGEDLTLGLFKNLHEASDWCPFDNFELYYLGKTTPTGIEGIEASESTDVARNNTSVAVYNLAGQRVSKAVKGLYIMNGKKVVVK